MKRLIVKKIDASVIDLSVEVRSKARLVSGNNYTFKTYAIFVLDSIATCQRFNTTYIDLVTDFYFELSIKSGTRMQRGTASRFVFSPDDEIPDNLEELLNNSDFKADLNRLFCRDDILSEWTWESDFSVTDEVFVVERISGSTSRRRILFQPNITSLEEADNRMLLSIRDLIQMRMKC